MYSADECDDTFFLGNAHLLAIEFGSDKYTLATSLTSAPAEGPAGYNYAELLVPGCGSEMASSPTDNANSSLLAPSIE